MSGKGKLQIQGSLEKLDSFLSSFFAKQGAMFWRSVEALFSFVYKETHSGIFGLFHNPEQLRRAARMTREKGYTSFDCFVPFPVHGLEEDMGLKRSKLPYVTFFAALLGLCIGFALQSLAHAQVVPPIFSFFDTLPNLRSYPLNIGGKPTFSWPAMIPICFELTVLLGGHATVAALILLSRLYRPSRPVLHPDITQDKFCLWIASDSQHYQEEETRAFLEHLGADEITLVGEKKPHKKG